MGLGGKDMEKQVMQTTLFGGVQWLLFMFTNTIVIPLSIGSALALSDGDIAASVQRSFIYTGIACLLQAFLGHRLALMEGQSGLWWGVILGLAASFPSDSYEELGGSLAIGIICGGILISVLGALGIGKLLKKWFTPVVMSVFLFLLAAQLIIIFFKGMLGLNEYKQIHLPIACLSFVLVILVVFLMLKGKGLVSNFALLIGIIVGWIAFRILFPDESSINLSESSSFFDLFPWGSVHWNIGIILTAILAGLINTTNTVASLKGAEPIYNKPVSDKQYRNSFILTGMNSVVSGLFGLVPYAPYTSSLGFLHSTRIKERAPFVFGAVLFILLGAIPVLGRFFSTLPESVGDAVLFVAYLQLFGSALQNIKGMTFNFKTIYRIAAPTLLGISLMNTSSEAFLGIPMIIRPLLSNGLLVGILLAVILENTVRWDKLFHEGDQERNDSGLKSRGTIS
jgi:xanthine/uracil permease